MTKRKVGLVLFWVGVGYAFLWAVAVSAFGLVPAWKNLTMDELRQTTWAFYDDDDLIVPELGTGMILWTTSIQLGALVAGTGLLLRSGARGSTMWGFGIGVVLVSTIPMGMVVLDHIPAFFSIGGTLILAFFFGMLWLWAKERTAHKGSSTAADFRLAGYVSMAIASWYV
jgi:hypothetical protein